MCLAISGLDPSGGAGLIADVRTFAALGVHGLGVVSAETVQNASRVDAVVPKSATTLKLQLDCLLEELRPNACKIGLCGGAAQLRLLKRYIDAGKLGAVVLDPVLVASRGQPLVPASTPITMLQLLPALALLTPNLPELATLSGLPTNSPAQAQRAAEHLLERGLSAILVKGGHGRGRSLVDRLLLAEGDAYEFAHQRQAVGKTHGTGCHLSSAIAAQLALGRDLPDACAHAIVWTQRAISHGGEFGPERVRFLDDTAPAR
ncbi:bifunctional hydroxymethylpyrimidine kinase/phosphomethylpyrimidine kinase [Ahniella affigens]|uniref:hydroxymethylpyrimidine kinase n=2 Tax=Ahniella affigens TaxID=2021234 RepID=A0A2P1PT32_9GAMM|nr:bifunctional hydroxymethylpyrimidine kinase/phosphomethylpyrimidine kinase [Ahniella affigens]